MKSTIKEADEILDLYFPVLDKGSIALIDYMGSDEDIESAARVSYAKGTRKISDTKTLLRYLYRHNHSSPYEQVEMKFRIKAPIYVLRQWIRHRTANVNEISGRYSIITDDIHSTKANEWRLQSEDNKQGSSGYLNEDDGKVFSTIEKQLDEVCKEHYNTLLAMGVAREQARKHLQLSTYSEIYWKCDLRNIFNFISQRCDSHAQEEIRMYANIMAGMVKRLCPLAFEAWLDYSFTAKSFSRQELEFLSHLGLYCGSYKQKREEVERTGFHLELSKLSKREYAEFWKKLEPVDIPDFELNLDKGKRMIN